MAVSPAEDILRTLTYNYSASYGSATYTRTTGIIKSNTAVNTSGISCSCTIVCTSSTKVIELNGHYSIKFNTGSTSSSRTLYITLKMDVQGSTKLNAKFSFSNLGANQTYTLTLDADGFATQGLASPRLYNITLVPGSTSYTYDDIFGPIATCSDIFTACGIGDIPETPSEVVYADNNTNTWSITNKDITYNYAFYIIDNPSQTYGNSQGVRYADLKKDIWSASSI